jgi:hypothetical protein
MKSGAIFSSDLETAFKLSDWLHFTVASGSLPLCFLSPLEGASPNMLLISALENDDEPFPTDETPWSVEPTCSVAEVGPAATSMPLDGCLSDESPSPAFSTPWETVAAWAGDVTDVGSAVASLPLAGDVEAVGPAVASLPLDDSFSDAPSFSTPWEPDGAWAGDVEAVGPAVASLPLEDNFSDAPSFSTPQETVGAWGGDVEAVGIAVEISTLNDSLSDNFLRYSKNNS